MWELHTLGGYDMLVSPPCILLLPVFYYSLVHNILHVCAIATSIMHPRSCRHAQVVLCTCTARAPRVETVLHLCMSRVARMSQKLNFLQLTSATGALRPGSRKIPVFYDSQLATARDRQFLVATVANRVLRRRKLYCESALKGKLRSKITTIFYCGIRVCRKW